MAAEDVYVRVLRSQRIVTNC